MYCRKCGKKIAVYSRNGFWELIIPCRKAEKKALVLHKVKIIDKKGKKIKRETVHKFQTK